MIGGYNPFAALGALRPQVLLVTYDLKATTHNYSPFYEALKQQGEWWHYISSTWLIATTKTPQQLYGAVVRNIVTTDRLLIIPVKKPYWGYMPKETWDWLDSHLQE
jgi:hypothetical protein